MAHLTPAEFGAAFDEMFTRSAFRLELLDRYAATNEAEPFRRFRAGLPQGPAWHEPWKQYVRDAIRDGKQMARVHVVSEPLSDYLEFELIVRLPGKRRGRGRRAHPAAAEMAEPAHPAPRLLAIR